MTTATLSRRIIRPMSTRPARRSMLIGFGATLAIGILLLAAASAAVGVAAGSNVLGGVSVAGVELAGLDRAAAASRLSDELPALDTGTAVLTVGETEIDVPYADLGRGYETEAMVDAAYGVGRSGNPIADGIGRLRSLVHATALPVIVHAYDDEALAADRGRRRHGRQRTAASRPRSCGTAPRSPSARAPRGAASPRRTSLPRSAAAVDNADPADIRVELARHDARCRSSTAPRPSVLQPPRPRWPPTSR